MKDGMKSEMCITIHKTPQWLIQEYEDISRIQQKHKDGGNNHGVTKAQRNRGIEGGKTK